MWFRFSKEEKTKRKMTEPRDAEGGNETVEVTKNRGGVKQKCREVRR